MLSLMPRIRALYSVPGEGGQGGEWRAGGGGARWRRKVREVQRRKQMVEKGCPYSRDGLNRKGNKNQNRNGSNESEEKNEKIYFNIIGLMIISCLKMVKNRRNIQLCSTGRRLGASTRFHIKVNMNAHNAWKLEPLNAWLFLLSSHLHCHQLRFISAAELIL